MRHGIVTGVLAIAACGGHGHGSQSPDGGSGDGGDQTIPSVSISNVTVAGEACAATASCDCLVFGGDTIALDVGANDPDGVASLAYRATFATAATTRADMALPAGAPSSASSPFSFQVPANVGSETVQLVANAADPASNIGMSPALRLCAAPPPAQGMPVVVWEDSSSGTRQIYLRQWNGSAWVELGGSGSGGGISQASSTTLAGAPVVAVGPDGYPVVAWTTRSSASGSTSDIYVKKWSGSAWIELGGSASGSGVSQASGLGAQQSAIAIDSTGKIYVAWPDAIGAPPIYTYVKRWNGTAWQELGGSASGTGLSGNSDASDPFIAIDHQDRPIVAWNEEIGSTGCWVWTRRWNGTSWEELAGSASGAGVGGVNGGADPSIAIDRDGNPSVGWQGVNSGEGIVMRWDGTAWSVVGSALPSDTGCSAGWPYMVGIDARNRPAIADQSGGVQRWNGAGWTAIAQSGSHALQPHGFAADGLGYVIVWSAATGGHNVVYLLRWDGSAWQEIGGSASGNGISGNTTGFAALPNVAMQ